MSLAQDQRLLTRRGEGTPPYGCEGLSRSILSAWTQPLCKGWSSDVRAQRLPRRKEPRSLFLRLPRPSRLPLRPSSRR